MLNLKRNLTFKSFRFRIIVLALLAVLVVLLLWDIGFFKKNEPYNQTITETLKQEEKDGSKNINIDVLASRCDRDIDSILFNFGIKKEWITTSYPADKTPPVKQDKSSKQPKVKKENPTVKWFQKDVSIPKDLTTAEINLELTTYTNFLGFDAAVNEDIRTTAINFVIYSPTDTSRDNSIPLAKINIYPTDKIKRDAGSLVLIISQISDFKKEQLENILNSVNEFSFIFPRNPEEIEHQNKLIQLKKDVLVNLTVGTIDNYDADFRIGMDDKELKQKVKSINSDFPSIKTGILSKINPQVPNDLTFRLITEEFLKNGIKIFRDTLLTKLLSKDEEDSDNRVQLIVNRIKDKASLAGKVIAILNFSNEEFLSFLDEVQNLKKRGYKFYTLSQYINREQEREKREKEKKETEEKEKKKEVKKDVKKEVKKDTKKTTKPSQTNNGKEKKQK